MRIKVALGRVPEFGPSPTPNAESQAPGKARSDSLLSQAADEQRATDGRIQAQALVPGPRETDRFVPPPRQASGRKEPFVVARESVGRFLSRGRSSPHRNRWVELLVPLAALSAFALLTAAGRAGPPNVRGKISGYDKLVPEVYAEAAKPEARRWTWREPSPSVAPQYRTLSANPSRDICIAATTGANQEKQEFRMTVTGGRVFPTTIVVTPNTQLAFKNFDPFKHRIYVTSATGQMLFQPEDLQPNAVRTWAAQGPGRYEVRDELFPSVRTFVIVDPQVVQIAYPGRDGSFGFSLPAGDYVLKAFFNGREVGKQINFTAKERGVVELKEPLKLLEGAETK